MVFSLLLRDFFGNACSSFIRWMTRCQISDLSWFTGCFGSNGIYFCIQNETGLIPAWQHASDFMQVFLLICSGSVALYRGENWKSGHFIRVVVNRPAEVLMKDTKFHRCRGHFVDLLHHRLYLQHLCSLPIKWKLKTWMRRDWKQHRCSERARWLLLSWWVCPRRGIGTGLWMPLSKTSNSDLSPLQLFSKPCNFNRLANLFEWFLQKKLKIRTASWLYWKQGAVYTEVEAARSVVNNDRMKSVDAAATAVCFSWLFMALLLTGFGFTKVPHLSSSNMWVIEVNLKRF